MTLSPMDDYPIHQVAEVIRHVQTSDRNFYDRYYFNCHGPSADLPWLIIGLGVYPNLGVADCFAVVRHHDEHIVVRASRALGADRSDLRIGPFTIEILEGLHRLRVALDRGHGDLAFDLVFDAAGPAVLEPRHFQRQIERVFFDTQRFVQTGTWRGALTVDGESFEVTGPDWRGNRDRSWGVRPVGEAEPPGRKADANVSGTFFWIYSVMRFADFSIVVVVQETETGERVMDDARRVWDDPDREPEWLGHVAHDISFVPGTRDVAAATLRFTRPTGVVTTVACRPQLANHLAFGTGYGLEPDWRHGMWQGELKVEDLHLKVSELDPTMKMFCVTDHLTQFVATIDDAAVSGDGLFEFAAIGPHEQYGFTDYTDTA
ncbi:hypothetical protein VX037_10750 [Gordonia sp. Z-3]|uniref:Uncharacterized protein n=1 Tax=Gordonia aquimaris TaxID=2984863 RepID=A0A9X3I2G8_9ACTN|nr:MULTISPECIES: hypothetical protein [Gordonia]MAU80508.1 hypothetical protein [Gordonia sp. (in: high G+C Gram-positive bacteria)]MCX2962592.1 hypothetical protein [Gordonia aquimaris]MED5801505.1 hypothetical protein [Gordonia sp. Z-3]